MHDLSGMAKCFRHTAVKAPLFIICCVFILGNLSASQLCKVLGDVESATDENVIHRIDEGTKKVWNSQVWNPKKKEVNHDCPRFATMLHRFRAGLGHKFTEVVFGMILAQETNSTFVLDDRTWSDEGNHGSYSWLLDFLPLDQSEVTVSELENFTKHTNLVTVLDRWEKVIKKSRYNRFSCNVFFTTHLHWCCLDKKLCWCTSYAKHAGAYERVKWRIREAFARSKYVPAQTLRDLYPHPSIEPSISIAWHVRQGDIVLNANEEHFNRLALQIASVLNEVRNIPFHFFFLGEGNITNDFPFLPGLCRRYFDGKCSLLNLDVRDTLFHMVDSDILITSGSSFAAFAAILRTDGIILYEYPKEMVVGLYEVSGQGLIHPNGTIITPSLYDLELQIRYTFHQHVKKMKKPLPSAGGLPRHGW